jgi:hypothetical protein
MEYVTYAEDGFNIIDADDEQSAESWAGQDSICLGPVQDFDEIIVKRIRELESMSETDRIVVCKHCGHENSFPKHLDDMGLDISCDSCGLWLEEYD